MFSLAKIMPAKDGVVIATVLLPTNPIKRVNAHYTINRVEITCPECSNPAVNIASSLVKFTHGDIDLTVADEIDGVSLSAVNDFVGNYVRGFKDGPLCDACGLG